MATYQSSQTSAIAASTSVTITKPTSLAVGDLLVAHLMAQGSSVGAFTVPSGWAEDINRVTAGSVGDDCRLQVLTKVAEAADVAASNFTFTISAADRTGGGLSRVTNYGKKSGSGSVIQEDSVTTPVVVTGFTPDRADCLFMVFTAIVGSGGSTPSLTSVSMATNNPSWTERYDLNASGLGNQHLGMATASRPEMTATGDFSVDFVMPTGADTAIGVLALAPVANGSLDATPDVIGTNDYVLLSPSSETFTDVAPATAINNFTSWTNQTKDAATWTDKTK